MAARPAHLLPLTSIRFFAALAVVVYHFQGHILPLCPRPLANVIVHGGMGVDLFFVLSGFILTYTYLNPDRPAPLQAKPFYWARFARVYPMYAVSFAVAAYGFFFYLRDQGLASPATAILSYIPVVVLGLHTWVPTYASQWVSPSWTLTAEAVFYALFPLLAKSLFNLRPRAAAVMVLVLFVLHAVAAKAFEVLYRQIGNSGQFDPDAPLVQAASHQNPLIHLPTLLAGIPLCALFFWIRAEHPEWGQRLGRGWVSFLFGFLILGMIATGMTEGIWAHGYPIPMAALILCLAFRSERPGGFLSQPWLVRLGEASYSLYILHEPLRRWLEPAMLRLEAQLGSLWAAYALCAIVAPVLVSLVAYSAIEVPARDWIRRRTAGKNAPPAAAPVAP